jgi:RNA polymerase sigma factor FliA
VALDERGEAMVAQYRSLARSAAWAQFQRNPLLADLGEFQAIAELALVEGCERYPAFCAERGYDPACTDYLPAYLGTRCRGALIDHIRKLDYMSRAERHAARAMDEAADRGEDRAGQAAAAGLTAAEADAVRVMQATRPVSLNDAPPGVEDGAEGLPDPVSVESSAVVSGVLTAAIDTMTRVLDGHACWLVALVHFYGLKLTEAAECLGVDPKEAQVLHEQAVLAIHQSMLQAAV